MPPATPSADRLLELVDAMSGRPVLLAVDLVADRFITGVPKRVSREAPVLILELEGEVLIPGGGANAVANVAALGGRPLPIGAVGDDESGRGLVTALAERGVATEGISVVPDYGTPTKTRILGGGRHTIKQQIVRYDREDRLSEAAAGALRESPVLARWAAEAEVAVLSDYGYGAVVPAMVAAVREHLPTGGRVLCDSRYRLAEFSGIDGATPNEEEALALAGPGAFAEDDRFGPGAELRRRLATEFLLVTRGSRGMSLFEAETACHLPVHGTDQVADVTGAGDTVIASFSLALSAGATPLEATLLANYAGGVVVRKAGTAVLSPEELASAIRSDPRPIEEIRWASS